MIGLPFSEIPLYRVSAALPDVEQTVKIEPTTIVPTISPADAINGAVGDTVGVVITSLAKALAVIFTQSSLLLVLVVASLGFAFVYWAVRLLHLRGR